MFQRHRKEENSILVSIPIKANILLHLLLFVVALLILRLWHLSVVQHEKKLDDAFRPRKKVIIEPAERGTIRDRFNIILAENRIDYRVSIIYSHFRQIPAVLIEKDEFGNKNRHYARREYINKLSSVLSRELDLPKDRVEDVIHSHAALLYNIPFCLKQGLTEGQYFRLKMLEKDWVGFRVERISRRYYPKGRVAADIIGYLGPIQKEHYAKLIQEIKDLSCCIDEYEAGIEFEFPVGITSIDDAKKRLFELQEKSYTINDDVGRLGIEASFEEPMRGYFGKKIFFSDARGNFVHEMPGSHPPFAGSRILLSISCELQEFCEKLLIQSEQDRESAWKLDPKRNVAKTPWVKGGSIVAIDPKNGEVIALATHPRFNPNDFIRRKTTHFKGHTTIDVMRWIEGETYLEKVWDQKIPLFREVFDEENNLVSDEEKWLTWDSFLTMVIPQGSKIPELLSENTPIKKILSLQRAFDTSLLLEPELSAAEMMNLFYPGPENIEVSYGATSSVRGLKKTRYSEFLKRLEVHKNALDKMLFQIERNQEKLLLLDLSKLIVDHKKISPQLFGYVQELSIGTYRSISSSFSFIRELLQNTAREIFREHTFKTFRKKFEKEFLQKKRLEEKVNKSRTVPYLDYLDKEEKTQFAEFWQKRQFDFLDFFLTGDASFLEDDEELVVYQKAIFDLSHRIIDEDGDTKALLLQNVVKKIPQNQKIDFFFSLITFQDLNTPLFGRYHLNDQSKVPTTRDLAISFAKVASPGHTRSFSFRTGTVQGSLFKLVTAYAGLKQCYEEKQGKLSAHDCKLFEIVDKTYKLNGKNYLGYFADGQPIPQMYKGGRLLKSLDQDIGKVDLLRAIKHSSNPYFSLLAGEYLKNPDDLAKAAREFGFGEQTKILLPGEFVGKVPQDLLTNKTGLYATAIGQHTLLVTPLQSASLFSALANGGRLLQPKIVKISVGSLIPGITKVTNNEHSFSYLRNLQSPNFNLPLLINKKFENNIGIVKEYPIQTRRQIFLPPIIRYTLLQAMNRVVQKISEDRGSALMRMYSMHPRMKKDLLSLKNELVGKSGTAESQEKIGLDIGQKSHMYNHVWFGGISFAEKSLEGEPNVFYDEFGNPELVVIVYLRYGNYGKEAAPLAASVVRKWREIKQIHQMAN